MANRRVDVKTRAFGRLLVLIIGLAGLLFGPAWSFHYWQAWAFLAVFFLSMLALTLGLLKINPELLERRLKSRARSEARGSQKLIHSLLSRSLFVVVILPVIDHRWGWSTVPPVGVVVGDVMVALGFLLVWLVFKENSFASATIELRPGQKTITTGPYAVVRHPMYLGLMVTFLGVPIALGSWWALLTGLPLTLVIIWRLLDEERFLVKSLPDYAAYQGKVRYRLAPFVW